MGTKYLKDITCNYTYTTSTTKKSSLFFNALFSVLVDTMDLYSVGITSIITNTFSLNIRKKSGIIRTAVVNFSNNVVKKAYRNINISYKALSNATKKAYRTISINFTQSIGTMDFYKAYITATNNINMRISNITKKIDKHLNISFITTICKNNKIYRNILIVYNYLIINNKLIIKTIANAYYKVFTTKTKKAYKHINTHYTQFIDTMDLYSVSITSIITNTFTSITTKSIKKSISTAISFVASNIRRLPDFIFRTNARNKSFTTKSKTKTFYHRRKNDDE